MSETEDVLENAEESGRVQYVQRESNCFGTETVELIYEVGNPDGWITAEEPMDAVDAVGGDR